MTDGRITDADDDGEKPVLLEALRAMPTDRLLLRLSTHLAFMLASTWDESEETRYQLKGAIEVFNVLADRLAPDEELYLCVPHE